VGAKDEIHAGAGDDAVYGEFGDDTIWGDDGNDTMSGGEENDVLFGGNGNDRLAGDDYGLIVGGTESTPHGDDNIDGGAGDDRIFGDGGSDVLLGSAGNDVIYGNNDVDEDGASPTAAFDGTDYIEGGDGNDTLLGDSLDDHILGGAGNDSLFGDSALTPVAYQGADTLDGGDGSDYLRGYGGNDMLIGGDGNDLLQGEEGDDYIDTAADEAGDENTANTASGGAGNDIIVGALHHTNTFMGDAGDDQITGEGLLFGGEGNDVLVTHGTYGTAGNQSLLQGGNGNDDLFVLSGTASVYGEAGDDKLYGGDGLNNLLGGAGKDTVVGGSGVERAFGGDGADTINGNAGNDQLSGGQDGDEVFGDDGDDLVFGDDGDDTLDGGAGTNYLNGGVGNDIFIRNDTAADDFIVDDGGSNILRFGEGISKDQLTFRAGRDAAGNSIYVVIEGFPSGGSVTVMGTIASFQFADGSSLSPQEVDDFVQAPHSQPPKQVPILTVPLIGSADDDTITADGAAQDTHAGSGNDTIVGDSGDDRLWGEDGNDRLIGGGGKNQLFGGNDQDTYVIGLADAGSTIVENSAAFAQDTIEFTAGILPGTTRLLRDGGNLLIALNGAAQITVQSFFVTGTADRKIETMRFADGTVWNSAQIASRVEAGSPNAMTGTSADNTFVVDSDLDTVTELANGGTDTIQSSVSYKLPTTWSGSSHGRRKHQRLGNSTNAVSYLTGNDGNNIFNGPGGAGQLRNRGRHGRLRGHVGREGRRHLLLHYNAWAWPSRIPTRVTTPSSQRTAPVNFTLPANNREPDRRQRRPEPHSKHRLPDGQRSRQSTSATKAAARVTFPMSFDGGLGADTMQGFFDNDIYYVDNPREPRHRAG
jgi:Ca2+-binding RTX toxin-like protein